MKETTNERKKWMDEWWINGWMNEYNKWMNEWMNIMNEWINQWMHYLQDIT